MARRRTSASRKRHRALAEYQRQLEHPDEEEALGDEADEASEDDRSAQLLDAASVEMRPRSRTRSAGAAARRKKGNGMIVPIISLCGLGLAVMFGLRLLPDDKPAPVPVVEKKVVDLSWDHPRVQAVVNWLEAIHAGNHFTLERSSHFPSLQRFLEIATETPLDNANSVVRHDVERQILAALHEGEATALFRECKARSASLDDAAMHDSPTGTVSVEMPPREDSTYMRHLAETGKKYHKGYNAQIRVSFVEDGDRVKVASWEVLRSPPKPRKKRAPHPTIAKPETRETEFGGEKIVITESEPVPLDHLEDTPGELRTEIDELIATLMDPDAPGATANRAIARLREIGRPAIPRLLNQMYEAKLDTLEQRIAIRGVVRALADMSGQRFGFSVTETGALGTGGTDEERRSALKQWYAWWYNNFDRDYTAAIDNDDEETLLMTDDEKAVLEAQQGEPKEAASSNKR